MTEPPEIPPPAPDVEHRIGITLGKKRYQVTIAARADEVKPAPADVVEMPKRDE